MFTLCYINLYCAAEDRWIEWFGSLKAGVFNWNCLSTKGWSYQSCISVGQDNAPLSSVASNMKSCGVTPNGH